MQVVKGGNSFLKSISLGLTICLGIGVIFFFYTGVSRSLTGLDAYALTLVACVAAFILAGATYVLSHLERKAEEETAEVEALKMRRGGRIGVFEDGAEPLYLAQNAVVVYRKFAPSVVGVLVAVASLGGGLLFWWEMRTRLVCPDPELVGAQSAFLVLVLGGVFFLSGVFCLGQSREAGFRWLRSVGGWLVFTAVVQGVSLAGIVGRHWGIGVDHYAALLLIAGFCVQGFEAITLVGMEFLRPRSAGAVEGPPVFESRLLSFLTEPAGVRGHLENALDYQFGFKISRTRMYQAWQKAVLPLLLFWLASLWLLTCFQEVGVDEMGVLERFGKRVDMAPLESGVYLKMPWPISSIRRFPVDNVQEVEIGSKSKDESGKAANADSVLWTVKHYAVETKYVVGATVKEDGEAKAEKTGKNDGGVPILERSAAVPVSLVVTSARVQFKVRKAELINYAYNFENPVQTLADIAEGVFVKHLARMDFIDFLSANRKVTCDCLKKAVQEDADKAGLGVDILLVNLLDSHPPVEEVAPAFQDVIGAREEKETFVHTAEGYSYKELNESIAQASRLVLDAEAYRNKTTRLSEAEVERYASQLGAYRNEPEIFKLRSFLGMLEETLPRVRKYVLAAKPEREVFIVDLQENPFFNLLGSNLMNDEQKPTAPGAVEPKK